MSERVVWLAILIFLLFSKRENNRDGISHLVNETKFSRGVEAIVPGGNFPGGFFPGGLGVISRGLFSGGLFSRGHFSGHHVDI